MTHFRQVAVALAGISSLAMMVGTAHAQQRSLALPAGKAVDTLPNFAIQSGLQIIAPSDGLVGVRTPALSGVYDVRAALRQFIRGTDLVIASDNGRTIVLRDRKLVTAASFHGASYIAPAAQPSAPVAATAAPEPQAPPAPEPVNDITVVGSQIKGAKLNAALPVTIVDQKLIAASGAVNGADLFRSIPQMGDITFNAQYTAGSSNSARGDVNSINLRNLGVGNTLVLLNGRRVVTHPTSQANDQLVPVLGFNSNAIPVNGLERLEVLRDGAAAIYGADAVAGVVNTVLKTNFSGADMSVQYGGAEGTRLREFNGSGLFGKNFADGRGNITLNATYDHGTGILSTDQAYTASSNKTPLFAGTAFATATSLDGRSTTTPWASLATPSSFGTIRQGTTALTTASGAFHIQPTTSANCALAVGNGLCVASGALATSGVNRDLRYDSAANGISVLPSVNRVNLFSSGHYDINDNLTAFFEGGFYYAKTHATQAPIATLSSIPITIPASNYYNPFGAAVFANGTVNPNRIAGTNVPAAGLPVTLTGYSFADLGNSNIDVTNKQFRLLFGLRGSWGGWNWESALSYSEATVRDVSDNISRTKLQAALALSTPDAYNVFNGGTIGNPSIGDGTPNSAATIASIREKLTRYDKTTLGTYDFRVSRRDLIKLPAGNVGIAAGLEARRESQLDDRDSGIDGSVIFTDPVTGATASNFVPNSLNPDTHGTREVASLYGELSIPAISPDMHVPLIHNLEFQAAGRFESYSDFGPVAVPKFAGAWDIVKGIRFRASWAKSFRAPNLEQTNASLVTRTNTRTDYAFCEADLRAKRISAFSQCTRSNSVTAQRAGNPDLQPERDTTLSMGVVIEPPLPQSWGHLTLTGDYWQVKQKGLVGVFGEGNALILDYLLRQTGGTNPNVVRAAPTADDVAAFSGSGLAPAGQVLYVKDQYVNLLPQTVRGLDFNAVYNTPRTSIGSFNVSFNLSHLLKYYQDPSPGIAQLLAARAAGQINAGTTITGGGDLLRQNGKPAWKWSAAVTWSMANLTIGGFTQFIGSVDDTSLLDSVGNAWVVQSQITGNVYADYRFTKGTLGGTSLRFGVRNLTNEQPPLSSAGYMGTLYAPYARYWYGSIRRKF